MTNNPTIDGVPLATLEAYIASATGYDDARLRGELRALLDAHKVNNRQMGIMQFVESHPVVPAVERQEPADIGEFSWTPEINEFYGELSNGGKLARRALCHIRHLQSGLSKHWKVVCDQRSRIDELQSTIDRLEARIAELESGRGEPVMKLEAERLWGGAGEYAVSFVKAGWLDECRKTGGEFLLYAAPPAPNAVVLPERDTFEQLIIKRDGGIRISVIGDSRSYNEPIERDYAIWRACLDATAALNNKSSTEVKS